MSGTAAFLWVNKTAKSISLSHSEQKERLQLLSHAQRTSRSREPRKAAKTNVRVCTRQLSRCSVAKPYDSGRARPNGICCDASNDSCTRNYRPESALYKDKSPSIQATLPLDPTWTSEERRSVKFFLQVTILKIITRHRDGNFWNTVVPSLAEQHVAFRHLIAAIASTHELLFYGDASKLNLFALTQCNKATRSLLQSSQSWPPALLLASCILVSAYSLLRCDLTQANLSIQSGLKIDASAADNGTMEADEASEEFRGILTRLGRQHGFKLWTPDINFQFERTNAIEAFLVIETDCIRGPFTDVEQVVTAYRSILVEVVAKTMRNVARGAYVDIDCSLAKGAVQQMALFSFYYESLLGQVSAVDPGKVLELKQVRIGYYNAYLVFHAKVISPTEQWYDAYPGVCHDMLNIGEEVVAARHAGRPVIYVDKIVNGALFSLAFGSRNSALRQRVVTLLQSQAPYEFGLVNWLRGTVIDLLMRTENQISDIYRSRDTMLQTRIIFAGLSCKDEEIIRVEYTLSTADEAIHAAEFSVEWTSWFGSELTTSQVDDVLQGIVAAYRMYGKPHASRAPRGYVREMRHHGQPVPVRWEERLEQSVQT